MLPARCNSMELRDLMEISVSPAEIARCQYRRERPHCASDVTDAERALIRPPLAAPSNFGHPQTEYFRNAVEAIVSMASSGCQ